MLGGVTGYGLGGALSCNQVLRKYTPNIALDVNDKNKFFSSKKCAKH
jgi:hypothetical protein